MSQASSKLIQRNGLKSVFSKPRQMNQGLFELIQQHRLEFSVFQAAVDQLRAVLTHPATQTKVYATLGT